MMPRHLAIVLDGNRRFAKKLMLEPWKGHEYGEKKVESLVEWVVGLGIKELTLYTFSMQNFSRPKEEFDYLIKLIKKAFNNFFNDERLEKNGIRVRILGNYHLFDAEMVELLERIMNKTAHNDKFFLNFALAYGGREEIINAIKVIAEEYKMGEIKEIDEKTVASHLYNSSEPDLIVRTGGEKRTSNFLPWQSVYSEWFFLDKTWPEFEKEDLLRILKEYSERERRYGK